MSHDINVYYVKPTEIEQVQFTVITLLHGFYYYTVYYTVCIRTTTCIIRITIIRIILLASL